MSKPVLCVDFDGVIHMYTTPWQGVEIIPDPPVPGALRWLWNATQWFDIYIYSRRSITEAGREAMQAWFIEHSIIEFGEHNPMSGELWPFYPLTFAHEKPAAFMTIDDRALRFDGDWSKVDPVVLLGFKPWNRL